MDSIKKLCNEVETVNGFCYLGGRLNSSGVVKWQLQKEQKLVG